jgi:6-phosphogluconolactonase (cycloisomerase 2 family)
MSIDPSFRPRPSSVLFALGLTAFLLTFAGSATATPALMPAGCWEPVPATTPTCKPTPEIGTPETVLVTRDGRSVYVIGATTDGGGGLAVFRRDAATGQLDPQQCFKSHTDQLGPCVEVPNMATPHALELTRDGRFLYVLGGETSLLTFARDPSTGELDFAGCIADDYAVGAFPTTVEGCRPVRAYGSGEDLAVAPDGRNLYVTGGIYSTEPNGNLIRTQLASFRRDPVTGTLALSDRQKSFGIPDSLAVSRDGKSLYGVLETLGVVRYVQRHGSWRLAWCLSMRSSKQCRRTRGLADVRDAAFGPNSRSVIVLSLSARDRAQGASGGLASFAISKGGKPKFRDCVEDSSHDFNGRCRPIGRVAIVNLNALALSGDGQWAAVSGARNFGSERKGSLTMLHRNRHGKLAFWQCFDSTGLPRTRCAIPPVPIGGTFPAPGRAGVSWDGSSVYLPSGGGFTGEPPTLLHFQR